MKRKYVYNYLNRNDTVLVVTLTDAFYHRAEKTFVVECDYGRKDKWKFRCPKEWIRPLTLKDYLLYDL